MNIGFPTLVRRWFVKVVDRPRAVGRDECAADEGARKIRQ
jgi:hypothetical protein